MVVLVLLARVRCGHHFSVAPDDDAHAVGPEVHRGGLIRRHLVNLLDRQKNNLTSLIATGTCWCGNEKTKV